MNGRTQWSLTFRYVAGILLFAAFVAFVFSARDAVRNFVVAGFVAYLLNPIIVYCANKFKMTRKATVNLVFFTAVLLLIGLPAALTPIFYDEIRIIVQDLLNLTRQLGTTLSHPVRLGGIVFHLEGWANSLLGVRDSFLAPLPEEFLSILETTSLNALWFFVILVSAYLLLSNWPDVRMGLFSFVLPPYRPEVEELYKRIRNIWMAYLRGQIVLMIIVGVVFTFVWVLMGIPGALVLGMIAGLFTLVPDVGPFIAVALAACVALLEGSTWGPLTTLSNIWVAALVIAIYLVLINLKNFFLRPIIMGRSVHMNEGIVFVAIIVATLLEGILGALLVVPVLASVVVIVRYLRRRILGLLPFEEGDSRQFIAPPEEIRLPRRRKTKPKETRDASDSPKPDSSL